MKIDYPGKTIQKAQIHCKGVKFQYHEERHSFMKECKKVVYTFFLSVKRSRCLFFPLWFISKTQ